MSTRLTDMTPIENTKENILPLRRGRRAGHLAEVIGRASCDQDAERNRQRAQLFASLKADSESEDPLPGWLKYVEWARDEDIASTGGNEYLTALKTACTQRKHIQRYSNDERFISLWIEWTQACAASNEYEPLTLFQSMARKRIGVRSAELYIAWAKAYEDAGDDERAQAMFTAGIQKGAQPMDRLQAAMRNFQARYIGRWRTMEGNVDAADAEDAGARARRALSSIGGNADFPIAGGVGLGSGTALQQREASQQLSFQLFQDDLTTVIPAAALASEFCFDGDDPLLEGDDEDGDDAAGGSALARHMRQFGGDLRAGTQQRENVRAPSKWTGVNLPQRGGLRGDTHEQPGFVICVDDDFVDTIGSKVTGGVDATAAAAAAGGRGGLSTSSASQSSRASDDAGSVLSRLAAKKRQLQKRGEHKSSSSSSSSSRGRKGSSRSGRSSKSSSSSSRSSRKSEQAYDATLLKSETTGEVMTFEEHRAMMWMAKQRERQQQQEVEAERQRRRRQQQQQQQQQAEAEAERQRQQLKGLLGRSPDGVLASLGGPSEAVLLDAISGIDADDDFGILDAYDSTIGMATMVRIPNVIDETVSHLQGDCWDDELADEVEDEPIQLIQPQTGGVDALQIFVDSDANDFGGVADDGVIGVFVDDEFSDAQPSVLGTASAAPVPLANVPIEDKENSLSSRYGGAPSRASQPCGAAGSLVNPLQPSVHHETDTAVDDIGDLLSVMCTDDFSSHTWKLEGDPQEEVEVKQEEAGEEDIDINFDVVDPQDATHVNNLMLQMGGVTAIACGNIHDFTHTTAPHIGAPEAGQDFDDDTVLEIDGNEYFVDNVLHRGRSKVYLAEAVDADETIDTANSTFAMKVFQPSSVWEAHMWSVLGKRLTSAHTLRYFAMPIHTYHYNDATVMFTPFIRKPPLHDLLQAYQCSSTPVPESIICFYAMELLHIVEHLHKANIIHGSINAHTVMLRHVDVPDGAWVAHADRTSSWYKEGLKLLHMCDAVDAKAYTRPTVFRQPTEQPQHGYVSKERRSGRAWTFEVDLEAVASVIHIMLHPRMAPLRCRRVPHQGGSGAAGMHWEPVDVNEIPDTYNVAGMWGQIFDALLNFRGAGASVQEAGPKSVALVRALRKGIEDYIDNVGLHDDIRANVLSLNMLLNDYEAQG